jgi:hypothetical protein
VRVSLWTEPQKLRLRVTGAKTLKGAKYFEWRRRMNLARQVDDRALKIAAMREIDSGKSVTQVARQLQRTRSCWRSGGADWRARGDMAFPGNGRKRV